MAEQERGEELGWKSWKEAREVATNRGLSGKDSLKPCVPLGPRWDDDGLRLFNSVTF